MKRKKNQKIINKKYKQKLRILKKLRFVEKGAAEIDGRKKLTAKDKRRISRAWSTHSEVTQSKNEFVSRKVDNKTAKLFKDQGYKTYKNKVYINKAGAKSVTIAHENVNGIRTVKIHKRGNQKDKTVFVVPSERLHELAEHLVDMKLKPGQSITGQFGDTGQWTTKFTTMEDFKKYLTDFEPQQPLVKSKRRNKKQQLELKRKLFSNLSIVEFKQ